MITVSRTPYRSGRRGFTLTELLVAVTVISILAAFLFPVLAQARDRAHRTTCLSNLRQIAQARLLYPDDCDERFSDWWQVAPKRPEPFGWLRFWPEYLQPYLRGVVSLRDPAAGRPERPEEVRLADYALLTWGPSGRGTREKPYWRWAGAPLTMAQVIRPSETVQVMDGWTTTGGTRSGEFRHDGGINAGFLDGRVRWLTAGELA